MMKNAIGNFFIMMKNAIGNFFIIGILLEI